ncbi:hypothetical protein ColKHC_09692 [Colletotrichum higginsianum]|nr:hypothetical protein ColKHC_09692 [Colletotrichum higginsianum]
MTMRPMAKDPSVPQEQTVLFVNNIRYNDPTAVQSIIQGATSQSAKTPLPFQSPAPALKSSNSVVHRPRPIPRQQGKDRQIFPAENSPNHKRSKSGGSIISRKSILMSNPGSPTQLPPLPPPPKSAGSHPVRALPNDTKSMTFDEKMVLFFPGALGNAGAEGKPRTPVPDMPVVPSVYKPVSNLINEAQDAWDSESSRDQSKQSDRSTKTSIRTQSILEIEEAVLPDIPPRFTSKFSVDTSVITGRPDEHESWIPTLPMNDGLQGNVLYDGAKRQSSPIIPIRNPSFSEFSEARTARTRDEETTTNWGSIHSPVAAVNIQEVTHMPKPTWIQPRDERNPRDLSMISHNDGKEVMTIMLDASMEHERDAEVPPARESPVDLPDVDVANRGAHWHRRIGDESITFSERKEKVQSRRQPPPMPLRLRSPVKKIAVVMHAAEPSPLESPQHAYEMIQAQLKKLEEPNRDSYESEGQRIRLLESLEAEMGQQENQWHEMQHGLSRNSLSTVGTTSVRNSQHAPTSVDLQAAPSNDVTLQEIPQRNNIALDRRASRRARMGSSGKPSNEDLRSASSISSQSNDNDKRTSLWEQRLADAQTEYMENASELLAKRNLNFLSVSKAPLSAAALQLGSPTPPDTDESDADPDDAQMFARRVVPNERAALSEGLWKPDSPVYFEREQPPLLWAPAHHNVATTSSSPSGDADALPGPSSVRPATRKVSCPLNISSSQLWQPDHTAAAKLRFTSGLWRVSWVPEAPKPQTRPVTQRPPRRSKRVTLLPDILESPQPLPDKRGTLGIFQFPWGERSDTATSEYEDSEDERAAAGDEDTKHDSMVITVAAAPETISAAPAPVSPLWNPEPKTLVITHMAIGLPQPDARLWRGYVEKMTAAPRVREHLPEPAVIHSSALWSPPVKRPAPKTAGPLWSKPQYRAAKTLWAAQPAVVYTESAGLFDPGHKRTCFRTTSAEPIGLRMPSGARMTSEELPQLMSASLWAFTPAVVRVENWMSLSSVGPRSPLEAGSSGRSTPSLDTASTRSDDEGAVSDFEPLPEVPVEKATWWDPSDDKMPQPAQAAPQLEPLRRTKAAPAEWGASSNEAVGSVPLLHLVRNETTPAEWTAALNHAMALSFNVAASHPAFAGSAIETTTRDPAVANPVFFSTSSPGPVEQPASCAPEEEPVNPMPTSHSTPLWSAPMVTVPKDTGIMWIPATKPRIHAHDAAPMKPEDPESRRLRIKRAKTEASSSLSALVSFDGQVMWNRFYGAELRRVTPRGGGRDWLEGAAKPPVSKVVFRY